MPSSSIKSLKDFKHNERHFYALDGLRGLAAIMVIFYHYSLELFEPLGWFASNFIFATSYAFVDLFFVLSGFVITHNYKESLANSKDLKLFFIKRIARLYPLLFITVLAYVLMKSFALLTDFQFDSQNYGWFQLLLETFDTLLFLNSNPLLGRTEGINPVSWSISAEMIAYAFFALSVYFFKGRKNLAFIVVSLLIIGFMLTKQRYLFAGDYGFMRGVLGFTAGHFVYGLWKKSDASVGSYLELFFFPALMVFLFLINSVEHEVMNLILIPLFSYGVFVFAHEEGLMSRWLKSKLMQYLGKISYSIYLWHFIVLWVFYVVSWQLLEIETSFTYAIFGIIAVLVVVIAVSHFSYTWIEKFGGRLIRHKLLK